MKPRLVRRSALFTFSKVDNKFHCLCGWTLRMPRNRFEARLREFARALFGMNPHPLDAHARKVHGWK